MCALRGAPFGAQGHAAPRGAPGGGSPGRSGGSDPRGGERGPEGGADRASRVERGVARRHVGDASADGDGGPLPPDDRVERAAAQGEGRQTSVEHDDRQRAGRTRRQRRGGRTCGNRDVAAARSRSLCQGWSNDPKTAAAPGFPSWVPPDFPPRCKRRAPRGQRFAFGWSGPLGPAQGGGQRAAQGVAGDLDSDSAEERGNGRWGCALFSSTGGLRGASGPGRRQGTCKRLRTLLRRRMRTSASGAAQSAPAPAAAAAPAADAPIPRCARRTTTAPRRRQRC